MSTRIIVKNLPKNITEEELKKHFSEKGAVTDVKIMFKEDGKSRNFCFIGFKDEQSAKNAVKYFNNTFLKTMKISVEIAKVQGDPSLKKNGKKQKNSKNKDKNNDNNETEEPETKQSKIKKILELSKNTKNAEKFDNVLKTKNENDENNNNGKLEEKTDNNDQKIPEKKGKKKAQKKK